MIAAALFVVVVLPVLVAVGVGLVVWIVGPPLMLVWLLVRPLAAPLIRWWQAPDQL